jgi:hypothetical protein
MVLDPEQVVQRQFEAYNARHLERFLATFSDAITLYRPPALEPALCGKAAFGDFYANERFNRPHLRAELLNRIVLGNKVFDHERIWGVNEQPVEMVVAYAVHAGLIQTVWGFSPA